MKPPTQGRQPNRAPLAKVPLLLMLAAAFLQLGYLILQNEKGVAFRWPAERLPIQLKLWNGFESASVITPDSNPSTALKEAVSRWIRSSSLSMVMSETSIDTVGQDGVSLITIADRPANRNLVGSTLGSTLIWSIQRNGINEILEADLVFNPNPPRIWSTVEAEDRYSLFDVALHELGHVAGLKHSIARSARMFVFSGAFDFGPDRLSWDDTAGLNLIYPLPGLDQLTGSIEGRVTKGGNPVFGAFVVAADETGVLAASAITMRDGSYSLKMLPPGRYALYAEPLDGPSWPVHVADAQFPEGQIDSNFLPRLYQDSSESQVAVQPRTATQGIDFQVFSGRTPLDPEFVGSTANANTWLWVDTHPAAISSTRANLIVAGKGAEQLQPVGGVKVLGKSIAAGALLRTVKNSENTTFNVYPLQIGPRAPYGDYPFVLEGGGSLGVMTGGLELIPVLGFEQPFAHFVHLPGSARSQALVVNADLEKPVQGELRLRESSGLATVAATSALGPQLSADAKFNLPPGGLLSAATGGNGFVGSMRLSGDRRVAASLLIETDFGTTGMGPGPTALNFVTPVDVKDSGQLANTGVALANLDERPVQVFLRLHDEQGAPRGQTIVDLPGGGQIAKFVGELIPLPAPNFRGTLMATADRRISAAAIRTSPNVFVTLPVVENRGTGQSLFAQFANAGSLTSEAWLVNPSSTLTAPSVEIQVRSSAGSQAAATLNGIHYPTGRVTVRIPPLGLVSLKTGGANLVGSLEVNSNVPIGGVVLYSSPVFGTAGVGESRPATSQIVALDREISSGKDTGLALFNGQTQPVTATMTVRDHTGRVVAGPASIVLQGYEQVASFPNEQRLKLGLPDTFTGSLWIDSNAPLAVTAIRQSPGALTTFPAFNRERYVVPLEPN